MIRVMSRRAARSASATTSARESTIPWGFAMHGRDRTAASWLRSRSTQPRRARAVRARASAMRRRSSTTSGTTRLAASVGVAARRSATRSDSGESGSCPIAETTGVRHREIARISDSSEKGRRSSTEPPPRARMMTSTTGSASSSASASRIWGTADTPCTAVLRTAKRTSGQRPRATSTTSRSAALALPVIRPTHVGRNGSGRLRRGSNRPSAARACLSRSMRASSSPTPTGRISETWRENAPRPV